MLICPAESTGQKFWYKKRELKTMMECLLVRNVRFPLLLDCYSRALLTETKVEGEDVSKQKWNLCSLQVTVDYRRFRQRRLESGRSLRW